MKMDADSLLKSPRHAAMEYKQCCNTDLSPCSWIKMLIPAFECITHLESRGTHFCAVVQYRGHKRYRSLF